jgi:hypothetical protein
MAAIRTRRERSSSDEKAPSPLATVDVVESQQSDDTLLEHLGYKPEFKRDFSFLGLFSLVSSELAVLPGVAGTIWCVVQTDSSLLAGLSGTGTPWDTLAWSA